MKYIVAQEVHVAEFDVRLGIGDEIDDGSMEPDLIAYLVSIGAIEPVGVELEVEPEISKSVRKKKGE